MTHLTPANRLLLTALLLLPVKTAPVLDAIEALARGWPLPPALLVLAVTVLEEERRQWARHDYLRALAKGPTDEQRQFNALDPAAQRAYRAAMCKRGE